MDRITQAGRFMTALRQLWILTSLTAAETLRQPVCLLLTAVCVVLTMAVPLITSHNLGESGRLARDSGLAFQLMFGLILAGYAACASLQRERNSGTLAAVLSKPVGRWTFFVAKFMGIAATVLVFSWCAALATLLAQRVAMRYTLEAGFRTDYLIAGLVMVCPVVACAIGAWANFRRGRTFAAASLIRLPILLTMLTLVSGFLSREGQWTLSYNPQLQWPILAAALLVTFGLIVLAAIALSLAVRLPLTPVVAICFGLLLLGLAADALLGPASQSFWGKELLYGVIPNWQHFWVADAIAGGGMVSLSCIARTALYTTLYTTGILCLGGAAFQHAEVS
jgi:hypothetical protein